MIFDQKSLHQAAKGALVGAAAGAATCMYQATSLNAMALADRGVRYSDFSSEMVFYAGMFGMLQGFAAGGLAALGLALIPDTVKGFDENQANIATVVTAAITAISVAGDNPASQIINS